MAKKKPKGSVIVIGGGIAGIEAALSLADAGYGVHLLEKTSKLGGMMPALHRIYPLCACCKLDPRIGACQQNPNIQVMLNTKVSEVSGSLGRFTVRVETDDGEKTLESGALVLASGIDTFEPEKYETYAYGRLPNVITSVEYERIQKPTGPEKGILKRPSDGRKPRKIAWLQCVGSRDINQCDAPYCSSVCCMYALKEALNTKEADEDIETTIFYMDMRTHGKGFENYLNNALSRGVRLVRSRVHSVESVHGTDDLVLTYADESGLAQEEMFDMVVLSVGLRPSGDAIELAGKTGIRLSEDQFIGTEPFEPVSTNLPGVFVCGGLAGPFDIGQSIIQASACAGEIASILQPVAFSPPEQYPVTKDVENEDPRVLVVCHLCPGMNKEIGIHLEENARKIPGVVEVLTIEGDILSTLTEKLKTTGANRLVFASCTPLIHKNLIEESLRKAGLNPYLYETVDLRVIDPVSVSFQAGDRIRMGVSRALLVSPPPLREIPVVKEALVVGGGVSGLESALCLSKEGYPVTIVEKENELGGHGRHVRRTWQGYDAQKHLKQLLAAVAERENITVMTGTRAKVSRGFAGNFITTLSQNGKTVDVRHGVTILASGGEEIKPTEYLYGKHGNVFTWSELSQRMIEDPSAFTNAKTGIFIQCVGSREPQRPHCSNLCCSFAVRTAIDLKEKNPDMNLYVLYREMRTFGERENLYREARKRGVVFIRYDLDKKPIVESADGGSPLRVTVHDPILGSPVLLEADFLSLQTAIVGAANQELASIFRINLDSDGFYAESPEKLKPVDTSTHGIYAAGLAHHPKDTGESVTQARAAAARALKILNQATVQVGGMIAEVRAEKCAVCCTCVRTCPFQVPVIDHEIGAAYIDPGLCQGCGICVAECPGKAIVMSTCSDRMLTEAPSLLLGRG